MLRVIRYGALLQLVREVSLVGSCEFFDLGFGLSLGTVANGSSSRSKRMRVRVRSSRSNST